MIPGLIKWWHERDARADAAFVDEVAEQAMRPGLHVVRPVPSPWGPVWDATVAQHGDPKVAATGRRPIRGPLLAAPLRGAR